MSTMHRELPPHIAQRAQRVFRLARSRLAKERLLYLQRESVQAADHVRRVAQDLHSLADTNYAGSRSAQTAKELEALAGSLSQLSTDLERPFLLFVVGMGKFGKSTLINALLGQRVAAMDALPKTWKIDVFTSTLPEDIAEIRTYDGRVERMPVPDAMNLIADEERRREASEEKVWELFQEQARELSSVTERELLRQELELLHLYRSPIVEVKWPVRAGAITSYFDVVDTPGLWQERPGRERLADRPNNGSTPSPGAGASADSQPFSLVSSEDLRSYYLQADGVLWMLDATKLAAGKPQELMSDLNAALSRVGGVTQNAVAVLNRIDLVRRNGGDEAVMRVIDQARRLLADTFQHIVPVSAREALEAREAGDEQQLERSGLPELLAIIDQRFRISGADVRWWSKSEGRHQYLQEVRAVSIRYRQELSDAERVLQEKDAAAKRHMQSLEKRAHQSLSEVLSEYKVAVRSRIQLKATYVLKMDESSRHEYLEEKIFQVHDLKTGLEKLQIALQKEYGEAFARLVPQQQFTAFRYVAPPPLLLSLAGASPNEDLSSIYVTTEDLELPSDLAITGVISVLGASILGPVGLVLGPLLSGTVQDYFASRHERKLQERLEHQLEVIVTSAREAFQEAIGELSRDYEGRLRDVREHSFAQVHVPTSKVSAVLDNMSELRGVAEQTTPAPVMKDLLLVPWLRQQQSRRRTDNKEVIA